MEFEKFPSIGRLKRVVVVTEKLDGTNAQICFDDDMNMYVGSRNRWIKLGDDNYGFAYWCHEHEEDLRKLGPGRHYGEWWGKGIQRGYNIQEKRFSLFNTARWNPSNPNLPDCCSVVPILYSGDMSTMAVDDILDQLSSVGSVAAPGFMKPEGIVMYHTALKVLSKVTLDNNDAHKGAVV